MQGCRFCGFLSDPSTGNIFDPTYPCPKCGRKAPPRPAAPPPAPSAAGLAAFAAPMTMGSNLIAAAKITGIGACFFYLHKMLGHMPDNSQTAAFKRASYFLPAMGLPYMVELITKEEWPILGTLFQVGMGGLAIKTALQIDTAELRRFLPAKRKKH